MSTNNPAPKLHKQTLQRLGDMLKLLKRGDNDENRNKIQVHCEYLSEQGKKHNFFNWVEIMENAKLAISNPQNEYKSTAEVIIAEIHNAGKKLEQNQEKQLVIGEKLLALVPRRPNVMELQTVVNFDVQSELLEKESAKYESNFDSDLWEDTFAEQRKIDPKLAADEMDDQQFESNNHDIYDLNLNRDNDLSSDLEQSIADLDLIEDDQSLDDWLEDDSFVDEDEVVSAVFLQQHDRITHSTHPDSREEINNLFAPEDDEEDLAIDQWDDNELSEEQEIEQEPDWQDLGDDESDIFILDDELEQIDESIDELSDLFDSDLEQSESEISIGKETLTNPDFRHNIDRKKDKATFASVDTFRQTSTTPEKFLIYDDFEDLEGLIVSENEHRQNTRVNWDALIDTNPTLYYDNLSELDRLINSPQQKEKLVNWHELEMLITDKVNSPLATSQSSTPIEETVEETGETELDNIIKEIDISWKPKNRPASKKNAGIGSKTKELGGQSMRVSVKQLDNLNNLAGELVVRRNRLEEDQDRLRQFLDNLLSHVQNLSDVGARMQDLYERSLLEGALLASRERNQATVQAQLARAENRTENGKNNYEENDSPELTTKNQSPQLDVLELDRFTGFHLLSQEVIELIVKVRESTSDIQFLVDETEQLGRNLRQVTTQLQEGINQSRMVAFAQNADRLPFPIRKIAQGYNKQVQLKVEGREVLIDKMILEHIWDPLLQLAKNSVTHGVEQPETRIAMGKPPMGTITVRAFLQGPQTVISVADDGAGIDPEIIKRKAIEKQLISSDEARNLKEQQIYDLLFHAGFTTKEKADSHAGRGVGLDIVRTQLNQIRGSVSIDSSLGKGTTFTIRLPLTLSIGKALCCINDNGRIAFPMDGIEDTKDYSVNDIQINERGQKCIPWRNNLLPYRPLSGLMNYNRQLSSRGIIYSNTQEQENISIVILRGGNNLLAVQVDQVLGQEEIVIKQISGPLPKPKGIAGATVRSDGIVMPIGDVIELVEIAQGKLRPDVSIREKEETTLDNQPSFVDENPLVLIVDDSITVREMLSLSFTKSGYLVEQARDGQEAWQKLRSGLRCNLIFCDIEMPRMNGLELLRNLQEDDQLAEIPLAILSSRGAEKHQRLAAELGASAYLVKPYVEKDLLDSAQKMLEGEVLLAESTKIPKQKNISHNEKGQNSDISLAERKSKSAPLVLIIDDSVVVREMLSMTFKKAGYQVEQARDGQDAWDKISNGLPCDVMLCDIEMPRMNGLELLARMQQDEVLSEIPVAMVTSRGAEKHRKIAAELGAKAYFTKPYLEEELLKATEGLIEGNVFL